MLTQPTISLRQRTPYRLIASASGPFAEDLVTEVEWQLSTSPELASADPRGGYNIFRTFQESEYPYDFPEKYGEGQWIQWRANMIYTSSDPFGPWTQRASIPLFNGYDHLVYEGEVWLTAAGPGSMFVAYASTLDGPWTDCTFSSPISAQLMPKYDETSGYWWTPVEKTSDHLWYIASTDDLSQPFVLSSTPMLAPDANSNEIAVGAPMDLLSAPFGRNADGLFSVGVYLSNGATWTWDVVIGTASDPSGPWTWELAQRYTDDDHNYIYFNKTDYGLFPEGFSLLNSMSGAPLDGWLKWNGAEFLVDDGERAWRGTAFGGEWTEITWGNFLVGDGVWLRWNHVAGGEPSVEAGTSLETLLTVGFEHPDTVWYMEMYYFGEGKWIAYYYPDDVSNYWPDYWLAPVGGFLNILDSASGTDAEYEYMIPSGGELDTYYVQTRVSDGISNSLWSSILEVPGISVPVTPTLTNVAASPQKITVEAGNLDDTVPNYFVVEVSRTIDETTRWDPENIVGSATTENTIRADYRIANSNERDLKHYLRGKVQYIVDFDSSGNELLWESDWSDDLFENTIVDTSTGQTTQVGIRAGAIFSKDIGGGGLDSSAISPNALGPSALATILTIGERGLSGIEAGDDTQNKLSITKTNGLEFRKPTVDGVSGDLMVKFPLDASGKAVFDGIVTSNQLLATDASIAGSSNTLLASSELSLSSGALKAPTAAPLLGSAYPSYIRLDLADSAMATPGFEATGVTWNCWYDADGGALGGLKTVWFALPYDGNAAVENDISDPSNFSKRRINVNGECHAACRVGDDITVTSRIYVMFYRSASSMNIHAFNRYDLTRVGTASISTNGYEPTMLSDVGKANTLVVIDANTNTGVVTGLRVRSYSVTSAGALTLQATTPVVAVSGMATADLMSLCATFKDSSTLYISIPDTVKEKALKFSLTRGATGYITGIAIPAQTADSEWVGAWGNAPWGLAWDGSMNANAGGFRIHNGGIALFSSTSVADASTYDFSYAFVNSDSPAKTTTLSPVRSYKRVVYARTIVDASQPLPTGATKYQFYVRNSIGVPAWTSGGQPSYYRSDATTSRQIYFETLTNQNVLAPSNTFTGGTPAVISAQSGDWSLKGDGSLVGIAAANHTHQSAYQQVWNSVNSTITSGGFWAFYGYLTVTAGTYLVLASANVLNTTSNQARTVTVRLGTNLNSVLAAAQVIVTGGRSQVVPLQAIAVVTTPVTISLQVLTDAAGITVLGNTTEEPEAKYTGFRIVPLAV